MATERTGGEGRFAYEGLDRVIHERARLSILTSLATYSRGLAFNELKRFCALTDGNLSRHLSVLEEAKLVETEKGQDGNRPQTVCRITQQGRRRYVEYLGELEQVIRDAAKHAVSGSEHEPAPGMADGLHPARAR